MNSNATNGIIYSFIRRSGNNEHKNHKKTTASKGQIIHHFNLIANKLFEYQYLHESEFISDALLEEIADKIVEKNTKNHKKGLILAYLDKTTNVVGVGYSLCRTGEKFDRERSMEIAKVRADRLIKQIDPEFLDNTYYVTLDEFPYSIREDVREFIDRVHIYYKNSVVPTLID